MFKWFKKNKQDPIKSTHGKKTLNDVTTGSQVKIQSLEGKNEECQRLREMGFCENAHVEKVAENKALICKVCDTRVIISHGLAKNIVVSEDLDSKIDTIESSDSRIVLLSELSQGQKARIYDFVMENDTCARLEEMGVTPGEEVEVVRYAPMGDPIEIRIRGYALSLRKEEADLIQVTVS